MEKQGSIFGLQAILRNYGWRNFKLDSILPLFVSLGLCAIMYLNGVDIISQLNHLVDIAISVIPIVVAIILVLYIIMLVFVICDRLNIKECTQLMQELNASFAVYSLFCVFSTLAMAIVSFIVNIGIDMPNATNYFIYFFGCYLLVYPIFSLMCIVIDIFNSGQTLLLYNKEIE